MNPDPPLTPREELEVRLTALLMGELPPDEAAALRAQMAGDPELSQLHARVQRAVELLREASAIPDHPAAPMPAQLSRERREHLLAHFRKGAPAPAIVVPRRDWKWVVPLGLAASLIALLGGTVLMDGFSLSVLKGTADSPVDSAAVEIVLPPAAAILGKDGTGTLSLPAPSATAPAPATPAPTFALYDSAGGRALTDAGSADRPLIGKTLANLGYLRAEQAAADAQKMPATVTISGGIAAPQAPAPLPKTKAAPGGPVSESTVAGRLSGASTFAEAKGAAPATATAAPLEDRTELSAITTTSPTLKMDVNEKPLAWFADRDRFGNVAAGEPVDGMKREDTSSGAMRSNARLSGDESRSRSELSDPGKPVSAGQAIELTKLNEPAVKQELKELRDEDVRARRTAQPAALPQPEIATSANAFSTFSLNVSDVAFKLAAASLEQGRMPDPATVRSEEFINAFDYRDPEPAAGAPLAFAAEWARYPFAQNRDLLRLSVKTATAGRQPGRALNLVLLLDNSGSMERADRIRIVQEALRVLAAQLQPQDKLSVITFARTPRLWADGVAGDKAAEVTARVGEITPQGGTNVAAALDLGYATALRHYQPGSINRVVLLTDGAANLGDVKPETLKQTVESHRRQGIALDCFGIGWEGYDDAVLEALSRNGDGRYGFINTPEEAATEFAGQLAGALRVAASDVKVQVEFNPRRVTAYRQIGYAKHQLTKEQFRDNTVDAAEIGAAESGNALYVVEVNPRGEGDLATVRVRFKVPGTSDYNEHEWPVPFTPNAPPLEQASPALRLAGTAGAFSEWLVASPFAAEVTPDRLLSLLNGVPAVFGADPRPQKLEWMIRTAMSVSGR